MTKKNLIENLIPSDEVNIIYSPKVHKTDFEKYMNKKSIYGSLKKLDLSYWEISIPKGTNQIQIKEKKNNEN